MRIVAFGFRKNVGKDTAGDYLVSKGYTKLSFATTLKRVCSEMYQVPIENFHDRKLKETKDKYWGVTPREMLIHVGSSFKDHWIKIMKKEIQKTKGKIVITDLRFENEFKYLKSIGCVMIRINRDSKEGCLSSQDHQDGQEDYLENYKFDYTIENNNSVDDLYKLIDFILN